MKPKKTPQPNKHYRCKIKRKTRSRYKMSELMADFKPEHRHGEWDIGPPVGKEICIRPMNPVRGIVNRGAAVACWDEG